MLEVVEQGKMNLRNLGCSKGDRVVIIVDNSVACVCFICACWSLGIIVVPLSKKQPESVIDKIVADVQPNFVVVDDLALLPNAVELDTICTTESNLFKGVALADLRLDHDVISDIIFTSGSTGEPKGVVHTITNHYYSALGAHGTIPFSEGDTWMASLPMYHISGLSLIMRSLLHGGALFFPKEGGANADSLGQVTHISLVPLQLARIMEDINAAEKLVQLKAVLVGGAPIRSELRSRALDMDLPLFVTYGSSEMSSQVTTTHSGGAFIENNSGQLLDERELSFSEDGEILVRGKTLCSGYFADGAVLQVTDTNGWFHTGDIGVLSDEAQLYVRGRKDSMFISGGENIFPEEIELALESHPLILKAVVVAKDDVEYGQRPVAFVEFAGDAVDYNDVKIFLSDKIAGFKIPDVILPWPNSIESDIKFPRIHFSELCK